MPVLYLMKHGRGEYSVESRADPGAEIKKTEATRSSTLALDAAKEYLDDNGYEVDKSGHVLCSLAVASKAFEHALDIGKRVPKPGTVKETIDRASSRAKK